MSQSRRSRNGPANAKAPPATEGMQEPAERARRAWRCFSSVILFAVVFVAGTAADLLSKWAVFDWLIHTPPPRSATLAPGLLRFTLWTNPGIVFGLRVPGTIVFLASAAAAVTVLVLFATSSPRFWGLHAALAMVLAGAVGNAYDRLFGYVRFPEEFAAHVGEVRDFIDVYAIHYPIFNVADVLLVVGVGIIMIHVLRQGRPARKQDH